MAGHLCPCLEIDEVEGLADLDVIPRNERERGGGTPCPQLEVPGFALRDWRGRMRHVGNFKGFVGELLLGLLVALLQLRDALLQAFAFLDERGAFLGAELPLHPVGIRVPGGAQRFQLLQELVPLVVEPHDEIRVRGDVPVHDVGPDRFDIVTDEFQIEHAGIIPES